MIHCIKLERGVQCPWAGSGPGSWPAVIDQGHWVLRSDSLSLWWLLLNLESEGCLRSESGSSRYNSERRVHCPWAGSGSGSGPAVIGTTLRPQFKFRQPQPEPIIIDVTVQLEVRGRPSLRVRPMQIPCPYDDSVSQSRFSQPCLTLAWVLGCTEQ